jgi:hypothetical protein
MLFHITYSYNLFWNKQNRYATYAVTLHTEGI